MNHQEVKHKGRACQVRIGCGHLAVMSRCPHPLRSSSNGTGEDSDQSDETDVDIRCKIHLQPDSPELPLTAGAPRKRCLTPARRFYFYSLLEVFTGDKRVPNDLINCFIISAMEGVVGDRVAGRHLQL